MTELPIIDEDRIRPHPESKDLKSNQIGEGVSSIVFAAELLFDNGNAIPVAIKRIPKKQYSNVKREHDKSYFRWNMFKEECPHILFCYGVCETQKSICLIMSLAQSNLTRLLSTAATTWTQRLQYALDCTHALSFLHNKNRIHRDIKSENFLLLKTGRVVLSDLDQCRELHQEIKEEGGGTTRCNAPETLVRNVFTKQTDIYMFSLVLYELLTLKKIFPGTTETQVMVAVVRGGRPDLASETRDIAVPAGFVRLICDCWSQEPDKRPEVEEIQTALDTIMLAVQVQLLEIELSVVAIITGYLDVSASASLTSPSSSSPVAKKLDFEAVAASPSGDENKPDGEKSTGSSPETELTVKGKGKKKSPPPVNTTLNGLSDAHAQVQPRKPLSVDPMSAPTPPVTNSPVPVDLQRIASRTPANYPQLPEPINRPRFFDFPEGTKRNSLSQNWQSESADGAEVPSVPRSESTSVSSPANLRRTESSQSTPEGSIFFSPSSSNRASPVSSVNSSLPSTPMSTISTPSSTPSSTHSHLIRQQTAPTKSIEKHALTRSRTIAPGSTSQNSPQTVDFAEPEG